MTLRSRISTTLADLPIRRKVRLIFILTTAFALLLAGLGIVIADSFMFYNYLRRDLATTVRIVGGNSTGALAFDDARAATETLGSLRARSHVEIACLYQRTGSLLATYRRQGFTEGCPSYRGEQIRYQSGDLVASYPIILAERPIGSLVLQYDLDEIVDRIEIYGLTVLCALLLSCALTFFLSSGLRSLIAQPILDLAAIARSVSRSKDYSIRAEKRSEDEFGALADALNQMMEGIQTRDNELRKALQAQRDALRRLAQVNSDLKRSNSDLERFAFMASHDLQEPLRMITSYSQLLVAERQDDGARPAEFIKYIVGGTKRMRELLADLLAYTQIAGSAEQLPELVDLNSILQQVQQTLAIAIEESQAQITAGGDLPKLYAHESRMASLFQNLLGNAIKYRGTQPPKISVSVEQDADHFTFSVADNGIGIQPEYREKIFVAFHRLHGKDVPGTGIGLAICQRVIERYGGRIWVESEFGSGSTFRFTLPKSMAQKAAS